MVSTFEKSGFSWWRGYGLDLGLHTELIGCLMGMARCR
jgi:hypothetical protein